MENLVNFINTLGSAAHTGPKLKSKDIILCQKELCFNGIATIPDEYLKFLHHFNALTYGPTAFFGIVPQGDFYLDILRENSRRTAFPAVVRSVHRQSSGGRTLFRNF